MVSDGYNLTLDLDVRGAAIVGHWSGGVGPLGVAA